MYMCCCLLKKREREKQNEFLVDCTIYYYKVEREKEEIMKKNFKSFLKLL